MKRPGMTLEEIIRQGKLRSSYLNRVGMKVTVIKDDKSVVESNITQLPWQLGHGAWVIGLEGFSGGYDILRVQPKIKL